MIMMLAGACSMQHKVVVLQQAIELLALISVCVGCGLALTSLYNMRD